MPFPSCNLGLKCVDSGEPSDGGGGSGVCSLSQEHETCEGFDPRISAPFPDCAPGLECVRRAGLSITGADKYCRVITPPGALAQEGENCEGFDETTNRPFPSCDQGLVCEYTGGFTIPGQNKICNRPGS